MLSRKAFFSVFILFNLAISLLLPQPVSVSAAPVYFPGGVVFVKGDAAGSNDGTSWANAFTSLQAGIDAAAAGDEVWVAAGSYSPGALATDSFVMKEGVKIYGGFAGTETALSQRSWQSNVTTLSGGGVNYHVFFHDDNGLTSAAVLDGFSITGGNAIGNYPHDRGGGMYNSSGSPTLTNLTFSGNSATVNGGGMYNSYAGPALTDVTFSGNFAYDGGGMYNYHASPTLTNVTFSENSATVNGGGMYNSYAGPALTDVTFSGNSAYTGGGMYNSYAGPALTNVTFSGNYATDGGGMFNRHSNIPTLTNVTFSGNSATYGGGGMYNYFGSATLTNVTFSGNSANSGGGMFNRDSDPTLTNVTFSGNSANSGGGMYNSSGSPTVRNSILWGNTPDQISGDPGTIRYGDVQGGYAGTGNINADPLFVDAANGDLRLQATSPAINRGDNALLPADMLDLDGDGDTSEPMPFDLAGSPRVVAGTVDMGAYEHPPIYVDDSATSGANDGTSWANAYTSLQAGIDAAAAGDEVWVAAGSYSPGDQETDSFVMKEGVKIYGGFTGTTETALSQRDWQSNVTTLSGGGVNYHVFFHDDNGLTSAAVLDGFSITGGNAFGNYPHDRGGGMYNYASSPTLTNVTFSRNSAIDAGGGMYNVSSSPTLTNVTFNGNSAAAGGGGMFNLYGSSPALTNVTFSGNSAAYFGGGMYNDRSNPTVRNSILWGNTPDQIRGDPATIGYSDVQGGYDGTGNINVDPLFVDAANGDLRLQAASPAINRGDNALLPADMLDLDGDGDTSEAMPFDLAGNPRMVDGTVDMGAYENQAPNHAPLLSGAYSLTALAEDPDPSANLGGLISGFLTGAGVSDADGNPLDIAITGVDNAHGQWQYSPNGAAWTNISGVSDTGALLLARSNSLRFMPNPNWNGTTTLTLRAWDGADGRASGTSGIDVSANGFVTAFSAASADLSQSVSAVNDAPVNTTPPAISGTPKVGALLTASTGGWNDTQDQDSATFRYAYQWQIADDGAGTNAADIHGATNPTYTPTQAIWVRVRVTATDNGVPGSASASASSAWVQVTGPRRLFLPLVTKH